MISYRLRPHLLPWFLLATACISVYGRVLGHDFLVNWDDNVYVTANGSVHGVTLENIRAIFTSYYAGNYAPLQMLSYMLDFTFWGLWPGGFLLTNVILHVLNGLLVYIILFRSYGERLLASVAAAIFLLHPVQVESVAWISQRKTLLAMFFMLLSWLAYQHYRDSGGGGRRAYGMALAAFLCSLLAKAAGVFFPVALLLYDYCFSSGGGKFRVADKVPFLFLSGGAALLAMLSQSPEITGFSGIDYGGRAPWHGGSPWATLLTMMPVLCRYLQLLLWPAGLSALYSPTIYRSIDLPVVAAFVLLAVVGTAVGLLFRRSKRSAFWALFALLALLPVSQLVPLITLMNDRYLYFPLLGVAALGGLGALWLRDRAGLSVFRGVSVLLLLVLALLSFQRVGVWKNSRTLWGDAVNKVPEKFDVWEGLGEAYHLTAPVALPEAEAAYSRAFMLYSSSPNNLFNLARVKLAQGDAARGEGLVRRLMKINPEHVMGLVLLGDIYLGRADFRRAESAYLQAERLQPEAVEVKGRLLNLYRTSGDSVKARFYADSMESLQ